MSYSSRRTKKTPTKSFDYLQTINIALLAICSLLSGLFIFNFFKYNILSIRFINVIIISSLILFLLISLFLIVKKKAKVFTLFLLLLLSIASGIGLFFTKSTIDVSNRLNETASYSEIEMSVVVPKDSDITDVTQLDNVLAPLNNDKTNIEALIDNIKTEKNKVLTVETVDSYAAAYEALMSGEKPAMIMSNAYDSLLEVKHTNYAENLKTIYTYKVVKKIEKPDSHVSNTDSFNIYISGIDTYGSISSVSRSDVNIIMTVNRKTNKVLLTTTPRDAYVQIPDGGNNQYDKLTHAGIYGVEASIHTLENLYDIKIDYYARINFTSFLKLIDLLGGIEVENDQAFSAGSYDFPVGKIQMTSDMAFVFVRERYSLENGDKDRGRNQTKVIAAIIDKLSSVNAITNYTNIINGIGDSIQTDMPLETMMGLANDQLSTKGHYSVLSQSVDGTGSTGELPSYAMPSASLYMLSLDENSLANAKLAIKNTMEGN
ncbi:LCP family protein [Streptococcus sp. CSL10205-OR2]|uniref:LCP family glycopolymer transferase CpsA n=1 Tax=Streptococcus sp. CSL10205-OR2 TaxID=2980558 RepID=UPI0021D93A30|nr:LCP family protein [Streptococcus sp. CSL10205-OR2]MCU9533600.1 LCP family protein [Streptococcus sp. CSL10205-OR2]